MPDWSHDHEADRAMLAGLRKLLADARALGFETGSESFDPYASDDFACVVERIAEIERRLEIGPWRAPLAIGDAMSVFAQRTIRETIIDQQFRSSPVLRAWRDGNRDAHNAAGNVTASRGWLPTLGNER